MVSSTRSPHAVAVWLCLLAALVYLLTYSGTLHAVDEQSALSVAESMLLGQGFHTNQMEWDQARTPPQNAVGVDGNLYSKKGLGVSLLALPLFALGKQATASVGAVQAALLTGSLLTLVAVWAFFRLALSLRYTVWVAAASALLLALGSPLWPYARTLFSETPGATGMALALWGMVAWRRTHGAPWLLLAGSGLALLILVKSSNAVVAPLFGIYWLWSVWEQRQGANAKKIAQDAIAFAAPVLPAVAATVAYNFVRFGTTFGFPLEPFETFSTPLAVGMAGLLFSPGKGIFWYFPALWLAPFFVRRWRVNGRLPDYLLAAASALALIVVYSLWYDWPGGRAWGPRMIITATPALAMLVLPAIDWLLVDHGRRWAKVLVAGVLVLSLLVQLPGALVNFERQEELDMQAGVTFDQLLWSPGLSPLVTYWQRIGTAPDPLLLQPYLRALPPAARLATAGCVGLAVAALALAAWRIRYRRRAGGRLATVAATLLLLFVILPPLAYADPRWDEQSAVREDNRAMMRSIQEAWQPGDVVLLDLMESSDKGRRTGQWLNFAGREPTIGWLRKNTMEGATGEQLAAWLTPYRRVWLLLQATNEGDSASTTEKWLDGWAFGGRRWWTGDQRVVEYLLPPAVTVQSSTQAVIGPFIFGGSVVLQGYQLAVDDTTGDVWLQLQWERAGGADIRYSVQALDSAGTLLAQVDGAPSASENNQTRVGLRLSQSDAHLILKLYRAGDGSVLPLVAAGLQPADFLLLAEP